MGGWVTWSRIASGNMPDQIGEFRVVRQLGAGGQGAVYLAESPTYGRVAIKVLHPSAVADPDARRRFLREAQVAASVAPFCTARVIGTGMLGDQPYIVSEYVPGPSLLTMVREDGPRTGGGLQRLAISTLTALASIHRAGIVHRDVKPANVILGPEGPVLIDFGIARAIDAMTTSTQVTGTPAFMSPELLAGEPVTPASDIFSWGVTMVFAATGRLPFNGDTIPSILNAILNKDPDLAGVPEPLRSLVATCLAKHPGDRPTAEDLLRRLTTAQGPWPDHRVPPAPAVGPAMTRSLRDQETRPSRRPLVLAGTVATGVALVAGAILLPFLLPDGTGADGRAGNGPQVAASAGPRPALDLNAYPKRDTIETFDDPSRGGYETIRPRNPQIASFEAPPTPGFGGGRIIADGQGFYGWFALSGTPSSGSTVTIITLGPFANTGATEDSVFAGRIKDATNYVGAWYNNTRKEVGIDVIIGGVPRHKPNKAPQRLNPGDRLALAVSGDMAIAYAQIGEEWRKLTEVRIEPPTALQNHTEWRHGFALRGTRGPIALEEIEGRSADG